MKGMMNFEWRIGWKVDRLSRYWNTIRGQCLVDFDGESWIPLEISLSSKRIGKRL